MPAILVSWYAGGEGGHALTDVLLGTVDASGRLPYSIPTTEAHLPFFDRNATAITYDLWHGQRLLDRDGHTAAYPLGFGLSYTSFSIDTIDITDRDDENLTLTVRVSNNGDRTGRHVVQVYGCIDADDFPSRVLLGFAPVSLEAGASEQVTVRASLRPLQRWTPNGFVAAAPTVLLEASAYSGDSDAATASFTL
ncbi:glycoside hydrolase family 3 C-terminal domain-containing protein [Microbacteriaceae bacterium VKM Ac-2854]|nr:glycoside hydrolase family 3 C-terminal domain-containing protein [Microbacteriaceae bacterium VKM Ac-2854]